MRRLPGSRRNSPRRRPISTRAEDLFSRGTIPQTRLDQARTALNVAPNTLRSRIAERSVIQQQVTEGKVLAPTAGPRPQSAGDGGHRDAARRDGRDHRRSSISCCACACRSAMRAFSRSATPCASTARSSGQERRAIRHHPPGLSADRGRPRRRRRHRRRARRLFRRRARARVGVGRRARPRSSFRPPS